jgi:transcriptional regulator with PAS, ATPase and Fis domain
VDCASLPEQLLESELFGHEKGAFTGAIKSKTGLIETAHRGTLFLDEIGEIPLALQSKLLRAIQERQVRRVGATSLVNVDVRFVAATNRDLRQRVADGQFREDLFYRINVIAIALPPLRQRTGDVTLLAHAFLKKFGGGRIAGFDDEALETMEAYAWPGNVRELQNVVERACALADAELVRRRDLPDYVLAGGPARVAPAAGAGSDARLAGTEGLPLTEARERWMAVLEGNYLRDLLDRHDGNISAAAKAAGIDRKTFHRLVSKHQIR